MNPECAERTRKILALDVWTLIVDEKRMPIFFEDSGWAARTAEFLKAKGHQVQIRAGVWHKLIG